MRWFFYYITTNKPVGGLKHIRLIATLLRELGVETFLLRDRQSLPGEVDDETFYQVCVPYAPFSFDEAATYLEADDILVLPEVVLEQLLPICGSWPCRLALYNQNGFYSLRFSPLRWRLGGRVEFALSNAPYVAGICRTFLGVPRERVFLIPYWVAREPFLPPTPHAPRMAVCYMPRKLVEPARQVREEVTRTHPDFPWVEIDQMPEAAVAGVFRENAIFFTTQHMEGFGLPGLEAMACGCVVTGFAGTYPFAHPYARPENGLWVRDGDTKAAAAAVVKAIELVREGGENLRKLQTAAAATAAGYAKPAVLQALVEMLDAVSYHRYRTRRQPPGGLGLSETIAGFRLLYEYDRLGQAGRLVSWVSDKLKVTRRFLFGTRGQWASPAIGSGVHEQELSSSPLRDWQTEARKV